MHIQFKKNYYKILLDYLVSCVLTHTQDIPGKVQKVMSIRYVHEDFNHKEV